MKKLLCLLLLFATICQVQAQSNEWKIWQKKGQKRPNILPMYGGKPKTKAMVEADKKFLAYVDAQGGTRAENSKEFSNLAWQHVYNNNDVLTAMSRFNQAWLLDSSNAEAYHGFGFLAGMFEAYKEAFTYFDRGYALDSTNANLLKNYTFTLLTNHEKSPEASDVVKADKLVRRALDIAPNNVEILHLNSKVLYLQNDYLGAWESLYKSKAGGKTKFDQSFIKNLHAKMPDPRKELVKE
ncbi:MAG: tetratricopeptide repeat protein [Rufibacter sp.]